MREEVWRVNLWANSVPPPALLPLQEEALHSAVPGIFQSRTIYFTLYREKSPDSVRMGEGQSPGAMKREKAAGNPTAPQVTFSSLFEISPLLQGPRHTWCCQLLRLLRILWLEAGDSAFLVLLRQLLLVHLLSSFPNFIALTLSPISPILTWLCLL